MIDLLGYAASCAVLATFVMRTMVPLRSIAILSNILFVAFAYCQHIYPVFLLHVALLPVNGWRLIAAIAAPAERASFGRPASVASMTSPPRPFGFWFAVGIVAGVVSSSAVLAVAANLTASMTIHPLPSQGHSTRTAPPAARRDYSRVRRRIDMGMAGPPCSRTGRARRR